VICVIAVLYAAKAFFFHRDGVHRRHHAVAGDKLSRAPPHSPCRGGRPDRDRVGAGATFMVGLIASPVMEWSNKLPELGAQLKEKLHVFDRPLALWQELQSMLGGSDTLATFQMPKFEWVQPTLEFLSPTFAEFLLFVATLILFIASWKDLRRAWS